MLHLFPEAETLIDAWLEVIPEGNRAAFRNEVRAMVLASVRRYAPGASPS